MGVAPRVVDPVVDFGKDKDLRNLLKSLQPKPFSGEGANIPKILEEWIITMDDYFQLAGYNDVSKGILGCAKLEESTKTWWKSNCQSKGLSENAQSWEEVKDPLKERYLPLNYSTTKNE